MVTFSIIIPNYNGIDYIFPCLESIENQKFRDYEIIVVDNASQDGSVEYIQKTYPNINLVLNSQNRGYAGGCNDGTLIASGENFLFLNTDTVLQPTFLKHLYEAINQFPDYGMYAPKMLYPDGRINSSGLCISLSGAAWDRGMGEEDYGQFNLQEEIFGPCGGAAIFKREAFFDAGGFDDDFFLFMEDVDLAFRTQLAGWRCKYIPEAIVYHHHGRITGIGSDVSVYYGNRNIIWYLMKDFPLWLLFLVSPWIIGRLILVILYYSFKGKGKIVLKAKRDAFCALPKLIKKRGSSQNFNFFQNIKHHFHLFAIFQK